MQFLKTAMRVLGVWGCLLPTVAALGAPTAEIKISCEARLSGETSETLLLEESKPIPASLLGFKDSYVKIEFEPYTLSAYIDLSGRGTAPSTKTTGLEVEPTLHMKLLKEPSGSEALNSVEVRGLEISSRPLEKPLRVFGSRTIAAMQGSEPVDRVDYFCQLVRLR